MSWFFFHFMPEYFHNWFPQRIISQLVSLIVSTLLFIIVGCYWFFSKHSANHGPTSSKVMWRSGNKVCSVTFVDRRGSTKREVTWNYCICNRLKQACVVLCALALSVTLLHKQKRTVLNRSLAGFGVHLFEKKRWFVTSLSFQFIDGLRFVCLLAFIRLRAFYSSQYFYLT